MRGAQLAATAEPAVEARIGRRMDFDVEIAVEADEPSEAMELTGRVVLTEGGKVSAVLRGLPTLTLRYREQDVAARRIAAWAQTRPEFVRVLHPSLPDSPGHAHWAALCTQAAGLVTVEVDPAIASARVDAFVDALRLFRIGWSWAGPVSLVAPYNPATLRQRPSVYKGQLVRLCIGLENVDDLIADLSQALSALR